MAAGSTYTPIATTTISGTVTTYTFSSIPSTYTDLILISYGGISGNEFGLQFNSDTTNSYGETQLVGNGTTASSARNVDYNGVGIGGVSSRSIPAITHIMNYANTTTFKASLTRSEQTRGGIESVVAFVNTWRKTNAITSITIRNLSGSTNITVGSTFTLYGITAA